MFGSYANTEGDDESFSNSASFNLASVLGNSKYKRRLGQKSSDSLPKPVRLNSSVKKQGPIRRVANATSTSEVKSRTNLNTQLSAIDEHGFKEEASSKEVGIKETGAGANISLSDMMLGCALNTPLQTTKQHHKSGEETSSHLRRTGDKVSPDSGSFSMTLTSKTHDLDEVSFTGSLRNHCTEDKQLAPHDIKNNKQLFSEAKTEHGNDLTLSARLKALSRTNDTLTPAAVDSAPPQSDFKNNFVESKFHPEHNQAPLDPKTLFQNEIELKPHPSEFKQHQHFPAPVSKYPEMKPSVHSIQESKPNLISKPLVTKTIVEHRVTRPVKAPVKTSVQRPLPMATVPAQSSHNSTPRPVKTNSHHGSMQGPSIGAVAMPPPPASVASSKDKILTVRGKRYKVMKMLGRGGSSRVYEAFDETNNIVVAIKRVELSDADESQKEGFINEINMLDRLQGQDRIIKLYDYENVVDENDELLYVVMEKGDTDLASLLKKYANNKELTPAMIKHYWTEMLHAVSCIHKMGIIHKDLKPANFMLVAGRLKLIDFGIASSVQTDKTSVMIDNQMGTFNYMSPESIQDISGPQFDNKGNRKPCIKISFKTDVWSLGCILYQLTYGKLPFADIKHPLMKLQAITNPDHVIEYPQLGSVDSRLVSVIQSCLERDISRQSF